MPYSFEPQVFFNHEWHGSGNRFARWDDARAFVDRIAVVWDPPGFIKGTLVRRVRQPANACWDPESKEAERFTEPDDNANQTTPANTPNSNHEPRVRRTRAATP
jgi:hypothetical protein